MQHDFLESSTSRKPLQSVNSLFSSSNSSVYSVVHLFVTYHYFDIVLILYFFHTFKLVFNDI